MELKYHNLIGNIQEEINLQAALILISKAESAVIKPGLKSHLTDSECFAFYQALQRDSILNLQLLKQKYQQLELFLNLEPQQSHSKFTDFKTDGFTLLSAVDKTRGELYYQLAEQVFNKIQHPLILAAADYPFLDSEVLLETAAALKERDLVIGPTSCANCYLLALNKPEDFLLSLTARNSISFLKKVLQTAAEFNLKSHFLPEQPEINTFKEFLYLRGRLLKSAELAQKLPNTLKFMQNILC